MSPQPVSLEVQNLCLGITVTFIRDLGERNPKSN